QPALSGKRANGSRNRRFSEPLWIHFSGVGELDFCLSANFSRRRIAAENPGRTIPRVLPGRAAFLARAKTARSLRESPARLGSGVCRRNLCLVVRRSRVVNRSDSKSADRYRPFLARAHRPSSNHTTYSKAAERVSVLRVVCRYCCMPENAKESRHRCRDSCIKKSTATYFLPARV